MDLNLDTVQSMAVGASGGLPLTLFLLHSMKGLRDSFETFKQRLENLSERLQKVEVVLEVTSQKEIKLLQERLDRIETAIFNKRSS
ncbi:MAG TPA: hypothetical protein VE954_22130 [Oligoflexus sp.]|uniref:hypothetical protein n=1 Tax=Oligoflexus sp. TaxID=1971216 RepID=UPI002D5E5C4D|nr:hypothetical protein [Oligoflexus sp.]HYX35806.1 hypothetical protein [Oligoflexus sp.]